MGSGFDFDFGPVLQALPLFVDGAIMTVELLAVGTVGSLFIGVVAGIGLSSRRIWVRGAVRVYVDLFRLTPLLVQIAAIFFLLPLIGISTTAFWSGAVALAVNYGAFYAEIFKAGITSIDAGQWEASRAMGFPERTIMTRIILPQAVRRMLPPVGNMVVSLAKDTSLVSAIGVAELMSVSQTIGASTFRNLEALLVAAAVYLIINIPLSVVVSRLHRKQVVHG